MHRIRALVHPVIVAIAAVVLSTSVGGAASAGQDTFFRIGTGGAWGTYYPVGSLIASAISNPPGSRPCAEGGSCGVPGLVAVAQTANGSVANVNAIASGILESGFAQSDVAYWAYTGTGMFEGKGRYDSLRAIASLYPESVHLVARKGSGIDSVKNLRGKRVSLDEPGSGTLVDARIILDAYGISESDLAAEYIKPSLAIEKISNDKLDAFFIIAGYPTRSVVELASTIGAELVSIDGPEAAAIMESNKFFSPDVIPAGTYQGIGRTDTIAVGAQWIVAASIEERLVYDITRALWNENSRRLLDSGHAKGKMITLETALDGVAIPLHPGALRFYRENGLVD